MIRDILNQIWYEEHHPTSYLRRISRSTSGDTQIGISQYLEFSLKTVSLK